MINGLLLYSNWDKKYHLLLFTYFISQMKKLNILLVAAMTLALAGCNTTIPVRDYMNQTIPHYGNTQKTISNVEKSIVKGAVSLGWQANVIEQGKVEATLFIRSHKLVVEITHDDKNYSIAYKDSVNLKYDGRKIHRQYANWVNNLINAINAENIRG